MFDLKVDPELFHHYIIGVIAEINQETMKAKLILKYGPLHFTNDDVENLQNAMIMSKSKIWETTLFEAANNFGCYELIHSLYGMKLAARANNATLYHFSSKEVFNDYHFELIINQINKGDKHLRKLLQNAKIHY